MFAFYIIASVVTIATSTNGLDVFKDFHKLIKDWREPQVRNFRIFPEISEKWITQPIDHFNKRENRTWQMRFYERDSYYNKTGPIFIMLGGEWAISTSYLRAGFFHDLARDVNALMLYTEHRYYGKSKPTNDTSAINLQYLNVDQALADVAYFIDATKKKRNIENSTVIVFGGSYSANMAIWMRLKYPHLVQGALASSAPVYAKMNFYEYLEGVINSLTNYKKECTIDIKTAVNEATKLIFKEGSLKQLQSDFKLCNAPNASMPYDVALFTSIFTEIFSHAVQSDRPIENTSMIGTFCDIMTNETIGSPYNRLSEVVKLTATNCNEANYKTYVEKLASNKWNEPSDIGRQWTYQTCTEYGYFQTTDSNATIFGSFIKLNFFTDLCRAAYGKYYDKSLLQNGVRRTNIVYGGQFPEVTNVIFVNGNIDPWHSLSVLQDLNKKAHAFFMNGTSHCADLRPPDSKDSLELRQTRQRNREIIKSWLH